MKTPGENGHPQTKHGSLEQILSLQPSKGIMPADSLILGFQPPELLENKFLMFMPPSLWYFVTEALAAELQAKCC